MSSNDCLICEDPVSSENPIIACFECGINVHKLCYGINKNSEKWKCSPCSSGKTKYASCQLCLKKGNPMKKTTCDKWVHVICALFTSGVTFVNEKTMEPIDISNISKSKRNKICVFCYSSQGFSCPCATKDCKNRLHITCAQEHKTLKEKLNPKDDTIKFNAYCKEHMPTESSRRISSESIEAIVGRKRKAKLKQIGAMTDATWILNQIGFSSTPKEKNGHKRNCK